MVSEKYPLPGFRYMNEARDDITDRADDKQIDAIVIDDDKSLVRIVQGKFVQGGLGSRCLGILGSSDTGQVIDL
jgi:hypothetical protein